MELENIPPLNSESRQQLERFQEYFNIRLPLGFLTLLQRNKIHRYIPHLWYANLKYDELDFIEMSSNRILLLWMKDCQDCWYGFILFDRYNPVPDPPVFSEPDGSYISADFFALLRRRKDGKDSMDEKTWLQEAAALESQLVLENSRLSSFLEHYAAEAKHWDMDDANSSLQTDDAADGIGDNDSDETSVVSPTVRRSKRLSSLEESLGRSADEAEQNSSAVEYEDFGVRNPTSERNGSRQYSDESSEEVEWEDNST